MLLEVVLALVLFVAAATVLTSGLSASLDQIERLRTQAHAADYAVSVLSELQMGLKTLAVSGPQAFVPPAEGWTWEIVSTPIQSGFGLEEASAFKKIEVIIRHEEPPLVYRLVQVLPLDDSKTNLNTELPGIDSF